MDFLFANLGYIWVILLIIFLIIEAVSTALLTIWFAFGALAAVLCSFITDNPLIQGIVFVVVSLLSLIIMRPIARKMKQNRIPTNSDAIIGKTALVTEEINDLKESGAIYVDGKEWTARAEYSDTIPRDTPVTVIRIEGVKVFVKRA